MKDTRFDLEDNFSFWKNMVLVIVFFTITPVALGVSLFSLFTFKKADVSGSEVVLGYSDSVKSGVRVYASLPSKFPTVSGTPGATDARPEIIKQYLDSYNSPLEPYSGYLVLIADKYNLDYRLLPAIAQQESNLCKIIPPGGHNCWGWGIHSEGTLGFDSYEESIESVAYGLRTEYLDKGYNTPEEIMSKYTPLSNGSWAAGVSQFMEDME